MALSPNFGKIIDGKAIAEQIKQEVIQEVREIKESGGEPALAVIIVGADPASQVYVGNKKKACEYTGIKSMSYELPEETTEDELIELIESLNQSNSVNGILVQLPLPGHINEEKVLLAIDPQKDVDGFHPYNVGLLSIGTGKLVSCTPAGIIELIKRSGISIEGKNCVVVGRSNIVGKPAALLLLREHGTVTVCHSRTKNLADICRSADILVAALGKPKFIKADMIKEGAVVIDVGIHRLEGKKLCGDVDFDECKDKTSFITPVPGGVGPMTIAMLMKNCIEAYHMQYGE
jgi:methylenetetrahydrofolate dehydrogenase (NADP+)/methenyltetrahydrofolate cyclohydrolase